MHTLLPKHIDKDDKAFSAVEELEEALLCAEEKNIRNIALTGPYGSGKSSILKTLVSDLSDKYKDKFRFLTISLATLHGVDGEEQSKSEDFSNDEKKVENLNRRIEYSIVQQLIYKEKIETLPNSRFRKIIYLSNSLKCCLALSIVISFIAFFVLIEPKFCRVDAFYEYLNFGIWNILFDALSALWFLFVIYNIGVYIIQTYSNSRINKVNLKDGEIGIVDNNSIFNKCLDEIFYFFQATKYNVVVIEDLDRFDTTDIFLKLRELNYLINESNIVKRHIVFVYAIKDDMFKDEDRTKFFDYITTVIPVINPSNSKDILKKALEERNICDGINDVNISEIAFFIHDKFLKGDVYKFISSKRELAKDKIQAIRERRQSILDDKKRQQELNQFDIAELKKLFVVYACQYISNVVSIEIKNQWKSIGEICSNSDLFDILFANIKAQKSISYQYAYHSGCHFGYNSRSSTISFDKIDKEIHYTDRLRLLSTLPSYFDEQIKETQREEQQVKKLTLKELLAYPEISMAVDNLDPMIAVFMKRGYIGEDYYDYISYFYEGMISADDRTLLLDIKRGKQNPENYSRHIDKINNFVRNLQTHHYKDKAILNNDLLDYAVSNETGNEMFESMMSLIECDKMPLDFLSQYYTLSDQPERVFQHILNWNASAFWVKVVSFKESDNLIEAYLKYAQSFSDDTQEWVNQNYQFLVERVNNIGFDRCLKIVANSKFEKIDLSNDELIDCAIEYNAYVLSNENLLAVTKRLRPLELGIDENTLNYSHIKGTQNENVLKYVNANLEIVLSCLNDLLKNENEESLLYIINDEQISLDSKKTYLQSQKVHITDIATINDDCKELAMQIFLVEPTWDNVSSYFSFNKSKTDDILIQYVEHFINELSKQSTTIEHGLFTALIVSNNINFESYKLLLTAIKGNIAEEEEIKSLEEKRLDFLIQEERIDFDEATMQIMRQTNAFSKYILKNSQKFLKHLDWPYGFNAQTALDILRSGKFKDSEKLSIIKILPFDTLKSHTDMAGIVIQVMFNEHTFDDCLGFSEWCELLRIASCDESTKVGFALMLIEANNSDMDTISEILTTLGGQYGVLCDTSKKPTFKRKDYNYELLNALKTYGCISSFSEKDKMYRAYHKKL